MSIVTIICQIGWAVPVTKGSQDRILENGKYLELFYGQERLRHKAANEEAHFSKTGHGAFSSRRVLCTGDFMMNRTNADLL